MKESMHWVQRKQMHPANPDSAWFREVEISRTMTFDYYENFGAPETKNINYDGGGRKTIFQLGPFLARVIFPV